jgi:UDP-glucose 4-epimerase
VKVLITGAGGNLGRVLAPALVERGHEPIMMDYRSIETSFPFIQGDITNKTDVLRAAEGVDAIVHAAALHGIHLSKYNRDDFWTLNVQGTYNVYEAARQYGVSKVLLCSTMGVYGKSIREVPDSFAKVTENLPLLAGDFYGESKVLCEQIAQFYSRKDHIQTIAYRLGMFVPESFINYGIRLLKGGVDDRDVAHAFILGLENTTIDFDAFNIMADVPFSENDFSRWRKESLALMEERFPGFADLMAQHGEDPENLLRRWGYTYWSIDRAKERLGYKPNYNFPEFYAELKEGNVNHYPYANLPWWGM